MVRVEFGSLPDLVGWLATNGIDTTTWGKSESKQAIDLWHEYEAGETSFENDPPTRLVEVVQILIRRHGLALLELEQEFRDGRRRSRWVPPSEKRKRDEAPRAAAKRCFQEELALDPSMVVLSEHYRTVEEMAPSPSYPGLLTLYRFRIFEGRTENLPTSDFFVVNTAADDPISRQLWGWRVYTPGEPPPDGDN